MFSNVSAVLSSFSALNDHFVRFLPNPHFQLRYWTEQEDSALGDRRCKKIDRKITYNRNEINELTIETTEFILDIE